MDPKKDSHAHPAPHGRPVQPPPPVVEGNETPADHSEAGQDQTSHQGPLGACQTDDCKGPNTPDDTR